MSRPSHRAADVLESLASSYRRFGRLDLLVNGVLVGLLALSWLTSLIGISQLSGDVRGHVDIGPELLIVFGALLVVLLMWVMLERARLPGPPAARTMAAIGYVFLAAWVAGFGYSFWWGAIAAGPETAHSLSASLDQADADLAATRGRYAALQDRLARVGRLAQNPPAFAARKACTSSSARAPDRFAVAERANLAAAARGEAAAIGSGLLPRLDTAIGDLRGIMRLADVASNGPSNRETTLQGLHDRAERVTRDLNGRLQADSRASAADLRLLATPASSSVEGECENGALTHALADAAADLERPPVVVLPAWKVLSGRVATEAALSRLWSGALRWISGAHAAAPFTARDWIALVAAVAVDLGILGLTLMRPRPGGQTFMGGLRIKAAAQAEIGAALARHSESAFRILYDHHFVFGTHEFIVIPDAASRNGGGAKAHSLHLAMASLSRILGARRIMRPSSSLISAALDRLRGLGWAPVRGGAASTNRAADGFGGGWILARRWLSGRLRPGDPQLYLITAADRDEAIRLLDEARRKAADWTERTASRVSAPDIFPAAPQTSPWPSTAALRYDRRPAFTLDKGLAMPNDDPSWWTGPARQTATPIGLAPHMRVDGFIANDVRSSHNEDDIGAFHPESDMLDWSAQNQAYLSSMIAAVRADLERRARRETEPAPVERPSSVAVGTRPFALEYLRRALNLSPFERDLLVLCAGVELESDFAELCAAVHGEPLRSYPTFGLALSALPGAHWSALSATAPLREWRLVNVDAGERLAVSPLRIDERILHYLIGVDCSERRLRGMIEPVAERTLLPPSYVALADRTAQAIAMGAEEKASPVVHLAGADGASQRAIANLVCNRLGLELSAAPLDALPRNSAELDDALQLWRREAILSGRGLLIETQDAEGDSAPADLTISRIIQGGDGVVLVGGRTSLRGGGRPVLRVDIPALTSDERRDLWSRTLGAASVPFEALPGALTDLLLAQFRLSPAGIKSAAAQALAGVAAEGEATSLTAPAFGAALWNACRSQSRSGLDRIAQRIEPRVGWNDLVLPEPQKGQLHDIISHLRHGAEVYDGWGFGAKSTRGLGVSALFVGPSGTGKTTAAEVLANDLDLDLYRIDLSQVVNKYIGETEKNLSRVFDAAEASGAILLFDEADALFGKRSEVKDSHDRYANLEVSYLLQRMETYRGLAILTTNMKAALDPAFMRRIRFVVHFPFPDPVQREEIWRTAFPPDTPTEGLDLAKLARLNVAGGHVRNIALGAAFLAAGDGQPVRMEHVLRATRSECTKLERPIAEAEIRGWV